MYRNILVALDLNDETSCHKPLISAVELARAFGARLHVLTVVREVPYERASSRSGGTGLPASSVAVSSSSWRFTW